MKISLFTGLVKRDTIGELGDSLADGLGLNSNGPMEDLDIDVRLALIG